MLNVLITIFFIAPSLYAEKKVIYGIDNRKDVFEEKNPLYKKIAKSTAGMVSKDRISYNYDNQTYKIEVHDTLMTGYNICSSEKFSSQKLLANCSGFLIDEKTLITAGHCMKGLDFDDDPCMDNAWVFNLKMESAFSINTSKINHSRVYTCKRIVAAQLTENEDFAIVELDRKVENIAPLKYRKKGRVSSYQELVVIGHPSMLPTKIANGGRVIDNKNKYQFLTSLDTFLGNSGSVVFDSKTGIVEGILVSGKTDYILSRPDDMKSCKLVNRCKDSGGNSCTLLNKGKKIPHGEAVTRITTIQKYL